MAKKAFVHKPFRHLRGKNIEIHCLFNSQSLLQISSFYYGFTEKLASTIVPFRMESLAQSKASIMIQEKIKSLFPKEIKRTVN